MISKIQIKRIVDSRLTDCGARRLVLLVGARQTGKTTSVRLNYPDLPYFNLDSLEYRLQLNDVASFDWGTTVGNAVLDEVQKLPQALEKVKFAYDEGTVDFSVLLGSAQILLLKRIRESLAGRVFIYELWPLTLSELAHGASDDAVPQPLLFQALGAPCLKTAFGGLPSVLIGEEQRRRIEAENHLLQWGGMPGLLHFDGDEDRRDWLRSYNLSYLERDLADLSRMNDLGPFRKFHTLAAARSTGMLSFSSLGNDAGVSAPTARKYLEYLTISYQAFFLPPFSRNITSTAVKTPKIYWSDVGLMRQLTGNSGPTDGGIFETHVISEIYKYVRTTGNATEMFFYRTRSGMEVDCLLKTHAGIVGLEIKNRERITATDAASLRALGAALGKEWRGGIVVCRGNTIIDMGENIWAMPSWRLLG
ncbi:MAG: ATP-binding protein [Chitinispirillaceae bacterium]|nr:ATP-binding protein [Chitinispirillaceae bacterium]